MTGRPKLDEHAARTDLTDRECAKILGGTIGGLASGMADLATIRRAVQWWAALTDEEWERLFPIMGRAVRADEVS